MVGRALDLFPGGPAEVVDRDPVPALELPSQRRESRGRSALPAMARRGTFRRCPEDSRIGGAYIARAAVTFRAADSPGGLPVTAIRRQAGTGRTGAMRKSGDIREAVEAELSFDPLVDDSDITVRNLNGD